MKERGNNQSEEKVVHLPPAWCGSICRNSMNEICIEHCAVERDCSAFDPKPNLKLADMPRFPKSEGMTKEEKFTSVTIYLSRVVDHLQGVEHGETYIRWPGPSAYGSSSRRILADIQSQNILFDSEEADTPHQDTKERENPPLRPGTLVEGDD